MVAGLMPRIRSIHPDACKSRKLAACSAEAERVYWRLQPHCDDEGRVEDDPDMLASVMFQVQRHITPAQVNEWLAELNTVGLIRRYENRGVRAISVDRWGDYQHPQKPRKSTFPPPPRADSTTATGPVRDEYATGIGRRGLEKETDKEKEGESEGEPSANSRSPQPVQTQGLADRCGAMGARAPLTLVEEDSA
jgi:hypothetical protein